MGWVRRDLSVWEGVAVVLAAFGAVYFLVANVVRVPADYGHIWAGEKLFADGLSPYVRHPGFDRFVFAPSAAILLWPLAASMRMTSRLVGLLNLALLVWLALGTWWATAGDDRRPSRVWAWVMLAVACFLCARMGRGNVDIVTASLVLAALVVVSGRVPGRFGRPWVAGLALGLAMAFKVTAVPVLVLLLVLQEWLAAVVATAVPLVLGAIAVLRVPKMTRWFTWTVPYLRHREPTSRSLEVSLHAVFPHASDRVDDLFLVVGVVIAVLILVMSGLVRRENGRSFAVLVLVSTMLVLTVLLVSPGGLPYYWVYALSALVVIGDDEVAAVLAAVALAALAIPASVAERLARHPGLRQLDDLRSFVPFVLLFVAMAIALRTRTAARQRAQVTT